MHYSLNKCHFCKSKLVVSYLAFARLTDYYCKNKKCHLKFRYYVSYDNDTNSYYMLGFSYKKYSFRFTLSNNQEIDSTIYTDENDNIYQVNDVIKISGVKDINSVIKRIDRLLPLM